MKIQPIKINNIYKNSIPSISCGQVEHLLPVNKKNFVHVSSVPAESVKATFLPSFGKFKTVDYAFVLDKDTNKYVKAKLQKEIQGDYGCYKLIVDKKEAGIMDIKYNSEIAGDEIGYNTEIDKNFPEVRHLRSYLGDKYSGIGTALMHRAVQDSKKLGKNGKLWLNAESGYDYGSSPYRSNESPIPFYSKLGFKSPNKLIDKEIQKYLEKKQYYMLPEEALMILSEDRVHILEDYYDKNFNPEE